MSQKLSVCIICKNEEDKIERCLSSLTFADEIVLLDSGSSDKTLTIAKKYTDKIYVREDWLGFGEQRRRAEELATNDWILAIDADEVVPEALQIEIKTYMQSINANEVLVLNRLTSFCGKFVHHSGWYPDPIVRIYNRTKYRYNGNLVHESVSCKGSKKIQLKANLMHYTFDNLKDYLVKRCGYAEAWAEERYNKGKKSSSIKAVAAGLFAFIRHYVFYRGFLDGRTGFLISVIQMQYTFNKYMLLVLKNDQNR
ncbi:glycosyltransferase family 2 protein [Thalassotalea psychrophila]|uniref:Glycosyltransferase family 2 protein n=1 Tax=Thalassotalea psychrophila TaxID=3065647 RepID=A0ABY9TWA4_9GAMM|nr:glycosyltransferase family 2 protein [Colwelliaceae bacterium SQ149]